MYCYDFICTYKLIDDPILTNILYQRQFLDAFELEKYDLELIKKKQESIYEKIKNLTEFTELVKILTNKYDLCNDDESSLSILFSYDYFDFFHRCLIDYFMKDKIEEINYKKLLNILNN